APAAPFPGAGLPSARGGLMRLSILLVALLGGCHTSPYCLTCDHPLQGGGDLAGTDLAGADLAGGPDLSGPCQVSNGGVEICDGLDNDCNGVADDVSAQTVAS